jgi:hypothetical protein
MMEVCLDHSCCHISQYHIKNCNKVHSRGRDSSVSIATGYRPDSPGIESRWGEIFRTCPGWPWGPPSLLYNGYRVFPRGMVLTTCPLLAPRSQMNRAIPLPPLWSFWVCYRAKCTFIRFTQPHIWDNRWDNITHSTRLHPFLRLTF